MTPCRLGILLSGRGSNFAALQQAIVTGELTQATIAVVLSNRFEAAGLDLARAAGLKAIALNPDQAATLDSRDAALVALLTEHAVDVVLLAGYDRIIGPALLAAFPDRILNIHPSLLPAYGGKGMVGANVHAAVLANHETESGCTVHLVNDVVDGGKILGQSRVPVMADDTPETLASRVLAQEHRLYPRVVNDFVRQINTVSHG
jgi:phosphoribosylglycinamide formyltransferase 1